jgi:hypothetical protein
MGVRWMFLILCCTKCRSDECEIHIGRSFCQEDGICYGSIVPCSDAYLAIASARPFPPRSDGLLHEPTISFTPLVSTRPVEGTCGYSEMTEISIELEGLSKILVDFVARFNSEAPRIIFSGEDDVKLLNQALGHIHHLEQIGNDHGPPCSYQVISQISSLENANEFVGLVLDTAEVVMRLPFPHMGYLQHLIPYLRIAAELTYIVPVNGVDAQHFWPRNIDLVLTASQVLVGSGGWRFRFGPTDGVWETYTGERYMLPLVLNPRRTCKLGADFQGHIEWFTADVETHHHRRHHHIFPTELAERGAQLLHEALAKASSSPEEVKNAMNAFCLSNARFITEVWRPDSPIHVCTRSRARMASAYFCAESIGLDQRVAFLRESGPIRYPAATPRSVALSRLGSLYDELTRIGSISLLQFRTQLSPQIPIDQLDELFAFVARRHINIHEANDHDFLRGMGRVLALAFANGIFHKRIRVRLYEKLSISDFLFRESHTIRKGFYDWYADGIMELMFSVKELEDVSRMLQ